MPDAPVQDWFTIEDQHATPGIYDTYSDVNFTDMSVTVTPDAMCKIDFSVMGLGLVDSNVAAQLTGATTPSGAMLSGAVKSKIYINSVANTLTSAKIDIKGNHKISAPETSTSTRAMIYPGTNTVTGTMELFFDSTTERDLALAETRVPLTFVFMADKTPTTHALSIHIPEANLSIPPTNDADDGVVQTVNFTGVKHVTTGDGRINSTIMIQDTDI
jgi:hypothetical protein